MLANVAACVLFVLLRPPAPPDYIADVAAVRATGGIILSDVVSGMVACRLLHPWDEWHGGEALGVKVLEIANGPASVLTIGVASVGELGLARRFSVCGWSWMLAGVFVILASIQWWIGGAAVERVMRHVVKRTRSS